MKTPAGSTRNSENQKASGECGVEVLRGAGGLLIRLDTERMWEGGGASAGCCVGEERVETADLRL